MGLPYVAGELHSGLVAGADRAAGAVAIYYNRVGDCDGPARQQSCRLAAIGPFAQAHVTFQ